MPRSWLTIKQVATELGMKDVGVRRMIKKKQIKATKLGTWKISKADLTAFIEARSSLRSSKLPAFKPYEPKTIKERYKNGGPTFVT